MTKPDVDYPGGIKFPEQIKDNISRCSLFVLIITYRALASPWVERGIAWDNPDLQKWKLGEYEGVNQFTNASDLILKLDRLLLNFLKIHDEPPGDVEQPNFDAEDQRDYQQFKEGEKKNITDEYGSQGWRFWQDQLEREWMKQMEDKEKPENERRFGLGTRKRQKCSVCKRVLDDEGNCLGCFSSPDLCKCTQLKYLY